MKRLAVDSPFYGTKRREKAGECIESSAPRLGIRLLKQVAVIGFLILLFMASVLTNSHAVPSFKRQTGMSCSACHTVFPELTPFGRSFKINGYVFSNNTKPFAERIPVSAMIQVSYTEQKGLTNQFDPFDDSPTAKFNIPQQASVFYAGKIAGNFGAFSQLTYSGVDNSISLDNTDIRYANNLDLGGTPLVYGLTVNNNPSVSDAWNTTPVWGFPFSSSAVAVTPSAGTIIDGTLGQQVGGVGIYAFWNHLIYAEVDVYGSTNRGIARPLGAGTTPNTIVSGAAPYGRLALQHQWGAHSFEVGTYGMVADVFPAGLTSGPTDRFTDYAFDGQYQFIEGKHLFTAQGTWIHEKQDWDASFPLGNTANNSDNLETWRVNLQYHYRADFGTLGGTVAYFSTTGDSDPVLYAPGPVTGSSTGSPNSSGFILQAAYLPLEDLKIVAQYVIYDKFNGASSNYDGSGRDASDNNTFYLLVWKLF